MITSSTWGGNSLKVIQLNSKLKEVLGKEVPVIAMFRYPTIRSFLRYLGGKEDSANTLKDEEIDEMTAIMNESLGQWDTILGSQE